MIYRHTTKNVKRYVVVYGKIMMSNKHFTDFGVVGKIIFHVIFTLYIYVFQKQDNLER